MEYRSYRTTVAKQNISVFSNLINFEYREKFGTLIWESMAILNEVDQALNIGRKETKQKITMISNDIYSLIQTISRGQ